MVLNIQTHTVRMKGVFRPYLANSDKLVLKQLLPDHLHTNCIHHLPGGLWPPGGLGQQNNIDMRTQFLKLPDLEET